MCISLQAEAELATIVTDFNHHRDSFIRKFDRKESRMMDIARQFDTIIERVNEIIQNANAAKTGGLIGTGAGLGLVVVGCLAAPFTAGAGLALAAGGAAGAAAGGAVAIGAVIVKDTKESGRAKEIEELGKEFMQLAEPLNEDLREIKALVIKMQQNAMEQHLMGRLGRIQGFFTQVRGINEQVLTEIDNIMAFLRELVQLILIILKQISTSEHNREFTDKIVKSGDECRKAIREFKGMKKELLRFGGELQQLT